MSSGRDSSKWSPLEEERVKAVLGKAVEQGAKALSGIVGINVIPSSWGLLPISIKEPPIGLFTPGQGIYSVMSQVHGDLYGSAALCLSVPNAESLVDGMLQKAGVTSSKIDPRAMAQSALEEASNVFVNGCLDSLSTSTKMEMHVAVPRFEQGSWEKMWGKIAFAQTVSENGVFLFADCQWSFSQKLAQFFLCLSPRSIEDLRQWAQRGKAVITTVGIGALEIASAPTLLKAPDLGSCVALVVYDSKRKMGGMAHVMLPKSPSPERGKEKPGKYADTAVVEMLARFHPSSVKLSAWLAGGADMLIPFISSIGSIGSQNAEMLRSEVGRAQLKLIGEDLGGTQARTVELMTETGELWIRRGQTQRREFL